MENFAFEEFLRIQVIQAINWTKNCEAKISNLKIQYG